MDEASVIGEISKSVIRFLLDEEGVSTRVNTKADVRSCQTYRSAKSAQQAYLTLQTDSSHQAIRAYMFYSKFQIRY